MNNHAKTPKEMETDVKKLAEKLEEIDSAEGIFGEVLTDEELDEITGGVRTTLPPISSNSGPGKYIALNDNRLDHSNKAVI